MIQKILLSTILILLTISQEMILFAPTFGIFTNILLILMLLLLTLFDEPDLFAQDALVISAIIPVISIISLSFNFKNVFFSESVIIGILIFLSFFYLWDFRLSEHPLRITRNTLKTLLITLPVFLIIEGGYLYFKHLQNFHSLLPIYTSILFLILLSIGEALYFFAITQNLVSDMGGKITGVIYVTILFTIFQTNNSINTIIFYGVLGLILTSIYKFSKNAYLIAIIIFTFQLTFYLSSGTLLTLVLH